MSHPGCQPQQTNANIENEKFKMRAEVAATNNERMLNVIDLVKTLLTREDHQSPYFNAKINGIDIVAFLDTGAEMSIISESFYNAIAGEKAEFFKRALQARTFSTAKFQCKRKARFNLQLGEEEFDVCVFAYLGKMSDSYDLLVGMDLVQLLQLEYSEPEQTITSRKYNFILPIRGPKTYLDKEKMKLYAEANGAYRENASNEILKAECPDYESMIKEVDLNHLDEENKNIMLDLIKEYKDVLARNPCEIGITNLIEHPITLTDDVPIYKRPYKIAKAHEPLLQESIDELLKAGVIKESSSPYSSPCILVFAPNKKPIMVVDFRELNKKTIGD